MLGTTHYRSAPLVTGLVQIHFRLPVDIKKEGNWFISSCPILDVFSQGETRSKALDNLKEAVRLFIESCIERGTLEQVLKDCGFEAADDGRRQLPDDEQEYLSVPVSLIAREHAEARTH